MNSPRQPHPLHPIPQPPDTLSDGEKYTALIKHMHQGYCVIDVIFDEQQQPIDYRFLEVNPLFDQLTGLVDAVGKTMRQLQPHHEQHWFELYGQVVKTRQSVKVEQQAAHLAGGVWYEVFAFPIGAAQPHQVGILFTDSSDRKQRKQQQAFLLQFSDRLRIQPNPDALATCALHLLLQQLGLDRCYIGVYRLDEDRGDFTHQVGNERVPPVPDRVRLSDFPDALRVTFERTLVIDDVGQAAGLTDMDRQNLGALGFSALVAATLRLEENHPRWAIIAVSARPRRWTPAEIALIEEVTERTWAALEGAKAAHVLQQAEANYRTQLEEQVAQRTAELTASRQLIQATLDSSQALIQVFQAVRTQAGEIVDFVWTLQNPAAERLFPNVIGQSLRKQKADVGLMGLYDIFKQVVETGLPHQSEHHYIHEQLNGWFYQSAVKLGDGVANTTTDITARKQYLESQQQSKARLQLALDIAQLGTWRWNLLTNEGYLDARGAELIGLAPGYQANVAQAQLASIHPDDLTRTEADVLAGIAKGVPFGLSYRVIHPDQSVYHIRSRFHVVADPTGRPVELMGTNLDITADYEQTLALRQREEQLRQLSANLESQVHQRTEELAAANHELIMKNQALAEANGLLVRSNANLQTFAYIASHDLQEPLRKIQQFGDLLKSRYTDSTSEAFGYLERMQTAASRMSTLIRDLLNYSRISTQRDQSAPVSLQTVVATVLTTLDWTIQQTGAQLQVGPLPMLTGDASQLGQLFQNLLSNALKFHKPDTPPRIQVWAQEVASVDLPAGVKPSRGALQYHRIDVMDNGVGFEAKYLDRIFQVFQRLHGKSEYAGTGIGLAICEKVVTNHGGAITATSQPGQGATFSVYLPV